MPRGDRSRSVGIVPDGHEGFGRDPGLEDGAPAVEDGRSMARSVACPAGRRVAHAGDEALDGVGVALRVDGDEVRRVVQLLVDHADRRRRDEEQRVLRVVAHLRSKVVLSRASTASSCP